MNTDGHRFSEALPSWTRPGVGETIWRGISLVVSEFLLSVFICVHLWFKEVKAAPSGKAHNFVRQNPRKPQQNPPSSTFVNPKNSFRRPTASSGHADRPQYGLFWHRLSAGGETRQAPGKCAGVMDCGGKRKRHAAFVRATVFKNSRRARACEIPTRRDAGALPTQYMTPIELPGASELRSSILNLQSSVFDPVHLVNPVQVFSAQVPTHCLEPHASFSWLLLPFVSSCLRMKDPPAAFLCAFSPVFRFLSHTPLILPPIFWWQESSNPLYCRLPDLPVGQRMKEAWYWTHRKGAGRGKGATLGETPPACRKTRHLVHGN